MRLGEAAELLRAMPTGSADVVYFDPMFTRPVKADTSFETLRPLAHHEALSSAAIAQARRVARRLVLVTDQPASGELERLGLRVVWNGQRKRYGAIEGLQAEASGVVLGAVEVAAGAAEVRGSGRGGRGGHVEAHDDASTAHDDASATRTRVNVKVTSWSGTSCAISAAADETSPAAVEAAVECITRR